MAELIVAKRYATALFELALENNEIDLIFQEVSNIYSALSDDNSFINILKNPRIIKEEKAAIINNIFKGKISDTIINLFMVLLKKNRESQLLSILLYFIEIVKEHKGIVVAEITSAVKLSDEQLKTIGNKLAKSLNAQIVVKDSVDPSIIGGLRVSANGMVMDETLKTKIDMMKNELLNMQLVL